MLQRFDTIYPLENGIIISISMGEGFSEKTNY